MTTSSRSLGHYEAPSAFRNDLDLLDRYQAFSSEILRIALLGLSGLGALVFFLFGKDRQISVTLTSWGKWVTIVSAIFFGLAAAAALIHRYCSADSMSCQLELLRLELANRESPSWEKRVKAMREERNRMLARAQQSIFLAPVFLAVGGLSFVFPIAAVLLYNK
jgi:hypothetical protein